MTEELTPEETAELQKFMSVNAPMPEEKYSHHKFLHDVSISPDTTKTGFLKEEEIGLAKNPIRTYKEIALDCQDIMVNPFFKNHFLSLSENITSTSLSREAMLLRLAIVQKRQIEDVTKEKQKKKGFFAKKEDTPEV